MAAAPGSWRGAEGARTDEHDALKAAVARAGAADPLLVDATALPRRADREVIRALGIHGAERQTRWLNGLQRVMLGQMVKRERRSMEHMTLYLRARGAHMTLPLEAVMRGSHRLRYVEPTTGNVGEACRACGPESSECGMKGVGGGAWCDGCGVCESAAVQHFCPFMDDATRRRVLPSRADRAEALTAPQIYRRADGCRFGCTHNGGRCFEGSSPEVRPAEPAVVAMQKAQEENRRLEEHGIALRPVAQAEARANGGKWLAALGISAATDICETETRVEQLRAAVRELKKAGALSDHSITKQEWLRHADVGMWDEEL